MTKSRANATAEAAKGDLRAGSGTNTTTILPVGSDGQTLVANSANSSGLGWSATPSASNPVINSAFQVWQRGTSVSLAASTSIANSYTADRFQMPTNANQACTVSRQATGDSTNLPSIQYCGRFQRNSGQTGTGALNPSYNLETLDSVRFAGKIITFSFYARAGANYSNASNSLGVVVVSGTGTDQNLQNGYTGQVSLINSSATLTTTWQRFTFTSASAVSSTATQLGFYFPWAPVGTAGANDYFEITGVQIDVGSVALPFRTNGGTFQGELGACQRYYQRWTGKAGNTLYIGFGTAPGTGQIYPLIQGTQLRTQPSLEWSGAVLSDSSGTITPSNLTVWTSDGTQTLLQATVTGATTFRPYFIQLNGTTTFLALSAEL